MFNEFSIELIDAYKFLNDDKQFWSMAMQALQEHSVMCPYCGETIDVLLDATVEYQQYIEDCFVCCRPIEFSVYVNADGSLHVDAIDENA